MQLRFCHRVYCGCERKRTKVEEIRLPLTCVIQGLSVGAFLKTWCLTLQCEQAANLVPSTNIYCRAWPPSRPCFVLEGGKWSPTKAFPFPITLHKNRVVRFSVAVDVLHLYEILCTHLSESHFFMLSYPGAANLSSSAAPTEDGQEGEVLCRLTTFPQYLAVS